MRFGNVAWRETAREWSRLFATSDVTTLHAASFADAVTTDAERAWVVLFTDGLTCAPCRTASTNLMRLSSAVRGLPVGVGVLDCELPAHVAFCRTTMGLPERPHGPSFRAWPRGVMAKAARPRGDALFDPAQIEEHKALELIGKDVTERDARLCFACARSMNAVAQTLFTWQLARTRVV